MSLGKKHVYLNQITSRRRGDRYEVTHGNGRDHMVVDIELLVKSVLITTPVVSSNSVHGEVYSVQHYVIQFVSDL